MDEYKEYKVAQLSNVIEVSNLEPPKWYDIKKGGHNYRWVNLTNLKLNESISNKSDYKKVYYYGLGAKGKLGYKDGTYYYSCKDSEFLDARQDDNVEWKFEIIDFFELYEDADYQESYYLMTEKCTQSPLYYNGNNGFKKIINLQINSDEILRLKKDADEAINYFMSLSPKDREGVYNGFEYKVYSMTDIDEFISYQLPDRQEDPTVIDSITHDVNLVDGNTTGVKPIIIMNLKTNILMSDSGKWLEGILNPAGNHRKKGSVAGGAIKMGTLKIPDFRIHEFTAVDIQAYAMADNPIPDKPTNPTGDDEFVNYILQMQNQKGLPINHIEIDKLLEGCGIKKQSKRDKLKKLAREKKTHNLNNTTPIKWQSKGWSTQGSRVIDYFTSDTSDACICSVETFNIEQFINSRIKFEKDGKVLKKFYYIMHGKHDIAWDGWDHSANGRENADKLISGCRIDNIEKDKDGNKKQIEIIFKRLPKKHASVGVSDKNFWKSQLGKRWLKDEGITLGEKK